MINVDGVVLGNFRCGVKGLDFNRSFNEEGKVVKVNLLVELVK